MPKKISDLPQADVNGVKGTLFEVAYPNGEVYSASTLALDDSSGIVLTDSDSQLDSLGLQVGQRIQIYNADTNEVSAYSLKIASISASEITFEETTAVYSTFSEGDDIRLRTFESYFTAIEQMGIVGDAESISFVAPPGTGPFWFLYPYFNNAILGSANVQEALYTIRADQKRPEVLFQDSGFDDTVPFALEGNYFTTHVLDLSTEQTKADVQCLYGPSGLYSIFYSEDSWADYAVGEVLDIIDSDSTNSMKAVVGYIDGYNLYVLLPEANLLTYHNTPRSYTFTKWKKRSTNFKDIGDKILNPLVSVVSESPDGSGSTSIDLSLGNYHSFILTGNLTITEILYDGVPLSAGGISELTVVITNPSNYTVTWPVGWKWDNATPVAQTENGTDIYKILFSPNFLVDTFIKRIMENVG